jgi:hypothetical protein
LKFWPDDGRVRSRSFAGLGALKSTNRIIGSSCKDCFKFLLSTPTIEVFSACAPRADKKLLAWRVNVIQIDACIKKSGSHSCFF